MLDVVPALPLVLADPLTQVPDVTSGMIDIVNPVRERNDAFVHLIFEIFLKFFQCSVGEFKENDGSILDEPLAVTI
ncbi:hypothetical protein BS47DRAFT_1351795 [Hydnum rufescens UP504]|uniref:Uncharacterized protein n=1 Tax=Hydnum rufescens UP504 TaxID=1448309 RepID=A0A9P6AM82_9AGAM|nr:hypothetical protein BS47DRAFT_1351795 [Hydnum rufescens UP504]